MHLVTTEAQIVLLVLLITGIRALCPLSLPECWATCRNS